MSKVMAAISRQSSTDDEWEEDAEIFASLHPMVVAVRLFVRYLGTFADSIIHNMWLSQH